MILDVESYDYAFCTGGATGFRMSMADPRDKPLMLWDSFNIAPGNKSFGDDIYKIFEPNFDDPLKVFLWGFNEDLIYLFQSKFFV